MLVRHFALIEAEAAIISGTIVPVHQGFIVPLRPTTTKSGQIDNPKSDYRFHGVNPRGVEGGRRGDVEDANEQ